MIFFKELILIATVISLICIGSITLAQWLNLSPIEYEKCTFNIFHYYHRNTIFTADLIESLLVSNQGSQLWTIHKEMMVPMNNSLVSPTRIPNIRRGRESCSVNVLVAVEFEKCFEGGLVDIFSFRVSYEENKFILIFNSNSACKAHSIIRDTRTYVIVPDVVFVYVNAYPAKTGSILQYLYRYDVEAAHSFCATCFDEYRKISFPIPLRSLFELSHSPRLNLR